MGAEEYQNAVGEQLQSIRPSTAKENRAVIYSIDPIYRPDLYPEDSKGKRTFNDIEGFKPYLGGFRKFYSVDELKKNNCELENFFTFPDRKIIQNQTIIPGREDEEEKEKEDENENEQETQVRQSNLNSMNSMNKSGRTSKMSKSGKDDKKKKRNPNQQSIKVHNNPDPNEEKGNLEEFYQGDTALDGKTKEGFGTYTDVDKIQVGTWRKDKLSGWGIETRKHDKNILFIEARFEDGIPFDRGMITYGGSNKIYEGSFDYVRDKKGEKFRMCGFGKLETDSFRYEGYFNNDQFHGPGEIEFKRSGFRYEGLFRYGEILIKGDYWRFNFGKNGGILNKYSDKFDIERNRINLKNLNMDYRNRKKIREEKNKKILKDKFENGDKYEEKEEEDFEEFEREDDETEEEKKEREEKIRDKLKEKKISLEENNKRKFISDLKGLSEINKMRRLEGKDMGNAENNLNPLRDDTEDYEEVEVRYNITQFLY